MLRRSPSRRAFLPRNLPFDSDFAICVTSDWSELQWAEARINDEIDLIIFEIREDIVAEAFHQCYDRYLEKQAVYFTVHCTGRALLKMIDVYYFARDPGELPHPRPELDFPNKSRSWLIDPQPAPAASDMWASNKVKAKPPGMSDDVKVKEIYSADSLFYPNVSPIASKHRYRGFSPPDERSETVGHSSNRGEVSFTSEEYSYSSEEVCKVESYENSYTSLQHAVTPEVEDSVCISKEKQEKRIENKVESRKLSHFQRGDEARETKELKKPTNDILIDTEPLQSELIPAMRIPIKDLPPLRKPVNFWHKMLITSIFTLISALGLQCIHQARGREYADFFTPVTVRPGYRRINFAEAMADDPVMDWFVPPYDILRDEAIQESVKKAKEMPLPMTIKDGKITWHKKPSLQFNF